VGGGSTQSVTQYSYDPFGNTTVSGAASGNPFQYIGSENDGNGLYFMKARYYSPALHRFISEDPIGFRGRNINLHSYSLNSPTNLRDPNGTCAAGALIGTILYNGNVVRNTLSSRKIDYYAGWSGLGHIIKGNIESAAAGCAAEGLLSSAAELLSGAVEEGSVEALEASDIRFSQTSINGANEIIESMEADGWVGEPIDVVEMEDGGLTTVDNTRVFAAGQTDTEVQAIVHSAGSL